MTAERCEKWTPVQGIVTPAARALIKENHLGLSVTLVFSEIVDGLHSDLRIGFGRVPAYTVHEEFVHPSSVSQMELSPELFGGWKDFLHPLLLIHDSQWLASFSDSQLLNYPGCLHYRFLTLDQIVDVLCNRQPAVTWVNPTDLPRNPLDTEN